MPYLCSRNWLREHVMRKWFDSRSCGKDPKPSVGASPTWTSGIVRKVGCQSPTSIQHCYHLTLNALSRRGRRTRKTCEITVKGLRSMNAWAWNEMPWCHQEHLISKGLSGESRCQPVLCSLERRLGPVIDEQELQGKASAKCSAALL